MSQEITNPVDAFDKLIASSQPEEIDDLNRFFEEGFVDAACADYYPPPGLTRKQKVAWELGYRSLSFSLIKKISA